MAFKEAISSGIQAKTQTIGNIAQGSPITMGEKVGIGLAGMKIAKKLKSIFGKSKLNESPAGIEVAKLANEKIDIAQAIAKEKESTQSTIPFSEKVKTPSGVSINKSGDIRKNSKLLKYDTVYNIIAQSKFADYGGNEDDIN